MADRTRTWRVAGSLTVLALLSLLYDWLIRTMGVGFLPTPTALRLALLVGFSVSVVLLAVIAKRDLIPKWLNQGLTDILVGGVMVPSLLWGWFVIEALTAWLVFGLRSEADTFIQRAFGPRANLFRILVVFLSIVPHAYWRPSWRQRIAPRVGIATLILAATVALIAIYR